MNLDHAQCRLTSFAPPIMSSTWRYGSRLWTSFTAVVLVGGALTGCGQTTAEKSSAETKTTLPKQQEEAERATFEEVAEKAGVRFTYRNGAEAQHESILESLGGGVGMLDYDLDGKVDLLFPGGGYFEGQEIKGHPPALFRNLGGWQFNEVSVAGGLAEADPFYSHGCSAGDFNNDGFPDFAITGYGRVHLWHNQGDGTWTEIHELAGIDSDSWSSSAAWGDLNGDGNLDLYLAHYVNWSFENHPYCNGPSPHEREICSPRVFEGLPDQVFYSQGDGTFRDASSQAGLRSDGKGLGVVLGDVDLDSDLDIYVANDTTDNFLYVNSGSGAFEESGVLSGVARDDTGTPNGSMGVDLCDYNNDGLPDLWCANYERESFALYRNVGEAQFLHVSQSSGITALGGLFVGFGTLFADIDRDGDEDVLISNGHVINFPKSAPLKQTPLLLMNDSGRFQRASFSAESYFGSPHMGRGLALGDLDDDGDLDVAISHTNDPVAVLDNQTKHDGSAFRMRLIGQASNRDAVGARVILHTSGGDQLRQVKGGGSYLSQSDLRLDWGIPSRVTVRGATILWPGGRSQEIAIEANQCELTVVGPTG